jgi:hypothetical protein
MAAAHDRELEQVKCSIDLAQYAKAAGYQPSGDKAGRGLTLLQHPSGDRIVVARSASGQWIYASVTDYVHRGQGESAELASKRLRARIARSTDKGSIVEFVQHRDCAARHGELGLEEVRDRLRDYQVAGVPLDLSGPRPNAHESDVGGRSAAPARDSRAAPDDSAQARGETHRGGSGGQPNSELNRRRYDWMPSPEAPPETEVEQRLRRWREAQEAIDQAISRRARARSDEHLSVCSPTAQPASNSLGSVEVHADGKSGSSNEKSALGLRRCDWTPHPKAITAISRGPRDRGQGPGR